MSRDGGSKSDEIEIRIHSSLRRFVISVLMCFYFVFSLALIYFKQPNYIVYSVAFLFLALTFFIAIHDIWRGAFVNLLSIYFVSDVCISFLGFLLAILASGTLDFSSEHLVDSIFKAFGSFLTICNFTNKVQSQRAKIIAKSELVQNASSRELLKAIFARQLNPWDLSYYTGQVVTENP